MGLGLLRELPRSRQINNTTIGRTPLNEWPARRRDLWQHTTLTRNRRTCPRRDSNLQLQRAVIGLTPRGHRNGPSDYTGLPKVKFSGLNSVCLWLSWQHRRIIRHVDDRSRYNQQRSGSYPDSWQAAMACAMCLRESCRLHWLIDRSGRTSACLWQASWRGD